MGHVTSLFARKVAASIEPSLDKDALLKPLGLQPDVAADPAQMIAAADYYRFLESIARAEQHGHTLPLRVGASMRCDDYGAFGLAWKSASNQGASLLGASACDLRAVGLHCPAGRLGTKAAGQPDPVPWGISPQQQAPGADHTLWAG